MKKVTTALLLGLVSMAGGAFAAIGTIDDVPAATLLLPYFEVDTNSTNGINTLFSVNNASATAVLAHVTFWTDQSVPTLDFDIYLTGYDVQTINIRDILVNGNLPVTASAGQDPKDTISPKGPISQDINFASCSGPLPYANPAVSAAFRAHLQAAHQGNPAADGRCWAQHIRDGILRGYVTVDVVNQCSSYLGPSVGYEAVMTAQNVLWGDYFYVNSAENFAQGETLVHIEACTTCFAPGDHTFYGRYFGGLPLDNREALPTTTAVRFLNGGGFDGGTSFIVWREGTNSTATHSCTQATGPSWYPLDAAQIVLFDEEENPTTQNLCPSGDPFCNQTVGIPAEANRISVADDLLAPFNFGWAYLNLQHTKSSVYSNNPHAMQSWVTTVMDASGRFSVGFDAIQLDNANNPNTVILGVN